MVYAWRILLLEPEGLLPVNRKNAYDDNSDSVIQPSQLFAARGIYTVQTVAWIVAKLDRQPRLI
jgi:hypothetical protein